MRALCTAAALLTLTGCGALGGWLNEPASDGPLVVGGLSTGTVTVDLPAAGTPEPIEIVDPITGATATITPPAQAPPVTRGDKIASSVGPIVTALTGNPFLALLLGGAAAQLSNRAKRKKA